MPRQPFPRHEYLQFIVRCCGHSCYIQWPSKRRTGVEIIRQNVKITLANGIEQPIGPLCQFYPCETSPQITHGSYTPSPPNMPEETVLRTFARAGDFSSTGIGWYVCWYRKSSISGVRCPKKTAGSVSAYRYQESNSWKKLQRTDVIFANFFSNLDIRAINSTNEQSTIKAKFHVRRARCLCAGCRNVLRDVRGRDENFRKRNWVVRQEKERKVLICVWICVDDPGNIHDESDGLNFRFQLTAPGMGKNTYKLRNVVLKGPNINWRQ